MRKVMIYVAGTLLALTLAGMVSACQPPQRTDMPSPIPTVPSIETVLQCGDAALDQPCVTENRPARGGKSPSKVWTYYVSKGDTLRKHTVIECPKDPKGVTECLVVTRTGGKITGNIVLLRFDTIGTAYQPAPADSAGVVPIPTLR